MHILWIEINYDTPIHTTLFWIDVWIRYFQTTRLNGQQIRREKTSDSTCLIFCTKRKTVHAIYQNKHGLQTRKRTFINAFEPSNQAAAADGPNTDIPYELKASVKPPTNGPSGPTTTKSIVCLLQKSTICTCVAQTSLKVCCFQGSIVVIGGSILTNM